MSRILLRSLAICLAFIAPTHAAVLDGSSSPEPATPSAAPVVANDNRQPAGRLEGETLTVSLRAGRGSWRPEGRDGPQLSIEALGEDTSPLTVPAPLIRTQAGTLIDVSLRNDLDGVLQVHGLCARDGSGCPTLSVPPGESGRAQF